MSCHLAVAKKYVPSHLAVWHGLQHGREKEKKDLQTLNLAISPGHRSAPPLPSGSSPRGRSVQCSFLHPAGRAGPDAALTDPSTTKTYTQPKYNLGSTVLPRN